MGEFNDTVLTLLEAFNSGIAILKRLRRRRKEAKTTLDPPVKAEEVRLGKSLRKNKAHVQSRYHRDFTKFGHRFATGDVEAQSALTAILFRLNAGFVSIIDRFTRGQSTRSDYQTLVNLSNASRIEAVKTFGQLSARLSRSSVRLADSDKQRPNARGGSKSKKSHSPTHPGFTSKKGHSRSKSTPTLPLLMSRQKDQVESSTTLQLANQAKRKIASTRSLPISVSTETKLKAKDSSSRPAVEIKSSVQRDIAYLSKPRPKSRKSIENRLSAMSISSDSTQIGEIPEHRLVRTAAANSSDLDQSAAFPLAPWKEPEKPRRRFMRLFGR